jgi:drug/metabolite transporter (DMT)-like permease
MTSQSRAYLFALSSILFWSTMGTAFKLTLNYMEPPLLLLISSLTAVVFLGTFIVITGRHTKLSNLITRDLFNSALMGLFNPFLYYMVLFHAYSMILAQEAVTLNYLWPVMLVVFSIIFLKQQISIRSIVAILVSFTGTFIIAIQGDFRSIGLSNPVGYLLASGSSLFWASFFILNMKDKREAYSKMFLNFCFGFLYILIWNLATGAFSLPGYQGWLGAIYIGIFEMGLTFALWLTALNLSSTAAKVSNLVYISPFLSLLLVSLIIGEKIMPSTIIGLAIIVSGIALQQWKKSGSSGKG